MLLQIEKIRFIRIVHIIVNSLFALRYHLRDMRMKK